MHLRIISPEQAVFDGSAESVVAPAFDGKVGILPKHAPFMSLLGEGTLRVRTESGEQRFRVKGGFLQVHNDSVNVVAEQAESLEEE